MGKSSETQRKTPQQSRSRDLVKAIYEATVRILPKVGSRNLTTKKVAEIAGVSIGSLYQYFPNKASLLGLVMDASMNDHLNEFLKKVEQARGRSSEEATGLMVDFALDLFLTEKEKVREIFMQAPELGRIPAIFKLRQKVIDQLAIEMEIHHPGKSKDEYQLISFISVSSLMGIVHTMLYDETKNFSKVQLSKELKLLLNSYFEKAKQS